MQRLGSNLVSSFSINTDFAESEVDTRRTNLTRFPLFFPETRTFFLDGSDIFQFGLGLGNELIPFFSRRIGLVSGREVPLLVGTKIQGRLGRTNLGGVVTRTREVADLARAATMGAARVKWNVLGESSMGMIATVGDPLGRNGSWLIGPDLTFQTSRFHGDKNVRLGLWGLLMDRQYARGDRTAVGFRADYPNDVWNISMGAIRIGDGFDPSLGFVPRSDVYSYRFVVNNSLHPKDSWLFQAEHEFQNTLVTDLQGRWESYRSMIAPINWRLQSGDRFEFNIVPTGEQLSRPFEVVSGVAIPPGRYHWRRYHVEAGAAAKRTLRGS